MMPDDAVSVDDVEDVIEQIEDEIEAIENDPKWHGGEDHADIRTNAVLAIEQITMSGRRKGLYKARNLLEELV